MASRDVRWWLACAPYLLAACSGGAGAPLEAELPCDVDDVLQRACRTCHGAPPAEGVPLSLVTYADLRAPFTELPLYDDAPVWKVMGNVVSASLMPEPPARLDSTDRATLLDWVAHGAPAATEGQRCPR
jgi:hypothetical protein